LPADLPTPLNDYEIAAPQDEEDEDWEGELSELADEDEEGLAEADNVEA
jgi:hypothetical protein